MALFRALHLPPTVFADFCEQACSGSLIKQAGGSAWLQGVLQEALCNTWFQVPRQHGVIATSLGSRPGDNLADLLFYFVFAKVLDDVKSAVSSQEGRQDIPWDDSMPDRVDVVERGPPSSRCSLHEVTWMDDLAVMSAFVKADRVLPSLANIAGEMIDCCLRRGMTPNLSAGKSEVVLSLKGPGARQVRASELSDRDPSVQVASRHWPDARIRVVPFYKHLGGILHFGGGLDREASCRAA